MSTSTAGLAADRVAWQPRTAFVLAGGAALAAMQARMVHAPGAWLSKVVRHICLNLLGSARVWNGATPTASGRATRPSTASHASAGHMAGSSTTPPGHRGGMGGLRGEPAAREITGTGRCLLTFAGPTLADKEGKGARDVDRLPRARRSV